MSESPAAFGYRPLSAHILWISDGKPRREMTPDELAERHRRDRETYRRMRERMAIDPEYRDARLAVSRETSKRYRERNKDNPITVERRRERDRLRYERLSEELGAKRRERYVGETADRIRARNRRWYDANRARRRAYNKAYRSAHRDELNERQRESRRREYALDPAKFNDYHKKWRRENPDRAHLYVRISAQRRRAAAMQTTFTTPQWLALVEHYRGRCAYCGVAGPLEIEHKIPLSRGGTNDISNIVPSCRRCNRRKRAKTDTEFRDFLERERATEASSGSAPGPGGSGPAG